MSAQEKKMSSTVKAGDKVNYNATPGDVIRFDGARYFVESMYSNGVVLVPCTGALVELRKTHAALLAAGARFDRVHHPYIPLPGTPSWGLQ